ncbi:MAG: hypothetical protein HP495_10210 [Nitrospira sp.]|nr:hypothetical protein [Nitrospira sp.]
MATGYPTRTRFAGITRRLITDCPRFAAHAMSHPLDLYSTKEHGDHLRVEAVDQG